MNWMYIVWFSIGAIVGSLFTFMINGFMNASHESDMESELYRKELMIRRLAAENHKLRIEKHENQNEH